MKQERSEGGKNNQNWKKNKTDTGHKRKQTFKVKLGRKTKEINTDMTLQGNTNTINIDKRHKLKQKIR